MPRYYLHICNGNGFTEDEEGLELPSLEVARVRAIEGLRDIMAAEMLKGDRVRIIIEPEAEPVITMEAITDSADDRSEAARN